MSRVVKLTSTQVSNLSEIADRPRPVAPGAQWARELQALGYVRVRRLNGQAGHVLEITEAGRAALRAERERSA